MIRGENDDELPALVELRRPRSAPRSASSNTWTSAARRAGRPPASCRATEILARHRRRVRRDRRRLAAPTQRRRRATRCPVARSIGVIASTTDPFCGDCDRARLTADGQLFTCLYATRGVDLRGPLRAGATDAELAAIIRGVWQARVDRGAEARLAVEGRAVVHRPRRAEGASRTSKCTRAAVDPRAAVEYAGHHRSRGSSAATCAARGGPRAVHHRHRAWHGRARGARALLRPHGRPDPRPGRVGARRVAGQHGRRGARRLWAPGAVAALGRRSAARLRRRHRHGRRGVPQGRAPSALEPRPDRRPSGAHPRGSADDRSRQPHVPALAGRRAPARGQPRPLRLLRPPRPQPDRQGARARHRGAAAADHRPLRRVQRHDLPARAGHQGGAGRPPRHRGGPPARLAGARSGGDRRGRPRTGRELPPARARHPPPGRAAQLQHPRPRAAGARRRAPALPRRRSRPSASKR